MQGAPGPATSLCPYPPFPPQLRAKFGNVFSLRMAWASVVVLNGPDAVREALVQKSEDTSDRPSSPVYHHLGFGPEAEGELLLDPASAPGRPPGLVSHFTSKAALLTGGLSSKAMLSPRMTQKSSSSTVFSFRGGN